MTNNTINLQAAIYEALNGNVRGLKVYSNNAPGDTVMPYVVISNASSVPIDHQTNNGQEITVTIHVQYPTGKGKRLEAEKTLAAIYDNLHDQSLNISVSSNLLDIRNVFAEVFQGSDGLSIHGVARYRALVYTNTSQRRT